MELTLTLYNVPGLGILAPGTPFTLDEIKYPNNWLELASVEDLEALNITAVVAEEPPPAVTLARLKEGLLAAAWQECETRLETSTVTVNLGGVDFVFGLDSDTRENISGIVNAINAERGGLLPAGAVPNPRPFAPKGSTLLAFSHEALAAVGAAVMNGKDTYMAAYFTHKDAINAATDPLQLEAYDVTTGWPAT